METRIQSYLNPSLEMQPLLKKGGFGIFALEKIPSGELLCMWGGSIVELEEFDILPSDIKTHGIQVEDFLFQVNLTQDFDPTEYFNHSCDPNAGLNSPISLVAMRDIQVGEEVCFDYAMSDSGPADEFTCACGAPNCRGEVTGNDWMLPDLQERYNGYFSPYLQRRIERIKQSIG